MSHEVSIDKTFELELSAEGKHPGMFYLATKESLEDYGYVEDLLSVPEIALDPGLYGYVFHIKESHRGELEVVGKLRIQTGVVVGDLSLVLSDYDRFVKDTALVTGLMEQRYRGLYVGRSGTYDVEVMLKRLASPGQY